MSRIGKTPIEVPAKIKVELQPGRISAEGPKGKLSFQLPRHTSVSMDAGVIRVSRDGDSAEAKAMHGLCRSIVNNLIKGVGDGFSKRLEINGVGFKASVQGKVVNMVLGYSHPINYPIPEQIKVTVEDSTKILIEGPDKQVVGQVASELRSFYPPEPYKGKGVKYSDEKIIRKEGKTVQ